MMRSISPAALGCVVSLLWLSGCAPGYEPTYSDARPPSFSNQTQQAPRSSGEIKASHLIAEGKLGEALSTYLDHARITSAPHSAPLIKKIAHEQIRSALESGKSELEMLALYTLSICRSEEMIGSMEKALSNPNPMVAALALRLLGSMPSERAARALTIAMRSNYLGLRLEASMLMLDQKRIDAAEQIEALAGKCPPPLMPLFAYLYAKGGSYRQLGSLASLMSHSDPAVRSNALLYAALFQRRSLEKHLINGLSHTHPLELEAAAFGCGHFQLQEALPTLERLRKHTDEAVAFAASVAQLEIQGPAALEGLEALAIRGNPYAITHLGNYPSCEGLLLELLQKKESAFGAALSLLKLKNLSGLPLLTDLICDPAAGFIEIPSPAHTTARFAPTLMHSHNIESRPALLYTTLKFKELVTGLMMQLPDKSFFAYVRELIASKNSESIDFAAHALAMRGSPSCTEFLEELRQAPGSPWLRMRTSLALFKLTRDPSYLKPVKKWLFDHIGDHLIEMMPTSPAIADVAAKIIQPSTYELKPAESSALLIDAWITLAHAESDAGLELILEAMNQSPLENRIVLSGLVLKALQ